MHDSTPATAAVGRETVRCVTKPEKNSWFLFDFAPRKIRPTHYTVRHYSTWDTEALRSWEFEGSNDGQTFACIRSHVNDTGLIGKGGTHTWKVDCGEKYSMFRIRQTDFNSNRHYYLAVSGFDIYGEMQEAPVVATNKSSLTFIHSYDFDTNGICYWLGTNKGVEPWQNPALRGYIRILYSTLAADSKPAYFVVGRETVRCVTEPKKLSWIVVDFKNIKIIPTHYSLKHYITFDTECLRNWRFEASDDSTDGVNGQWVTLITHNNDTSMNRKGATHTWAIPPQAVKNQPFSKYRLFQFGPNSNSHHYLPCSGFEIYGTVVSGMEASTEEEAPSGVSRVFKYTHDMDYNGLFYFLGTNGGERQWINPVDSRLVIVEASSLMSDSVPLSALCGRSSVRCVTKPHQKSWMSVNLKDIKIKLTHYTLRHYNSWDTEALRFWTLEGSNDGVAWIPLRQHNDDRALRKSGMPHTWTVETSQYFSRFRIFMTGRNSNNHWYLACSGMELYGDAIGGLASQKASAPPPMAPIPPPVPKSEDEKVDAGAEIPSGDALPDDAGVGSGPLPLVSSSSQQIGPELSGEAFAYSSDLDTHGICYWLGTNCGTEAWQNPMKRGALVVRSNGLMNDSVPLDAIVGREVVRCVTKPVKQAWFEIDFQNYAILPTHYTLRHYSSWDTEALRNWRLEASCDGERWTVLREHKNDTALNLKGQTYTWTLTTVGYFSRFRIFQFDKNSNSHYYLSLSGFEIYGHVIRQHSTLSWDQWPKSKSKSLNVDATRNVVQNAGSNDQWQTCKAREPMIFGADGLAEFSLLTERMENTTNSWKFMAGIAPESFTCQNNKQWLGAQKSWGYIAGTGGKCYDVGKSLPYGQKWGSRAGDCVTVVADAKNKTIEFILNGVSQGVAFDNFDIRAGSMFAAVSLTATNSSIRLMNRVSPSSGPPQSVQRIVGVPYTSPSLPSRNPVGSVSMPVNFGWDATLKSPNLAIFPDGVSVTNKGSNDTWQGVVSQAVFQNGKHSFEVQVINDTKTTNTWKFIVGVAPLKYDPRKTAWLGSQNSWGYIGGTGGKCHQVGKTVNYGATFGSNDIVKCQVNFDDSTIEFFVNGKSQGVAFDNLTGPVKPAVSLCGKGSCLRIANVL